MHATPRTRRSLGAALAAGAAALVLATPVADAGSGAPAVPPAVEVPAGHREFLVTHAEGVQIYACGPTASGYGWALTAPRATLRDRRGKVVGTHFAGPTWQATDGSTVVGRRVDGATVDPTAIPWLLIEATATSRGDHGARLTRTTYIQRTATAGGLPPAAEDCHAGTAGTSVEVAYTADYHFWRG
jgi:hypothetical protein